MKTKIIHYFNQGARTYHSAAEVQTYVAKQLAARIQNDSATRILEIGCGTGLLTQHIMTAFPHAQLLLTDIAPEMLSICHERFAENKNISTTVADGETLSLHNSFHLITSSMALHWFENIESGIKNIIKQLATGGRFVFAMLGRNSLCEWRSMCKQFDITPATLLFPDADRLKQTFPQLQFEIEQYKQTYSNAHAFLTSLKLLGARTPVDNHIPTSTSKLRHLFRHYPNDIHMTYEIIYGCYTKC